MSDTENWSPDWKSSTNPSKQRKYRDNAPHHVKGKLLSANINDNIREELGTRSLTLRTGDKVEVMRGDEKGEKGIVKQINREETRVYVNDIEVERNDGSKQMKPLRPSNLQIQGLNLEEPARIEKYDTEEYEDLRVSEDEVEEALEEDEENEMMQRMQGGQEAEEDLEELEEVEETEEAVEEETETEESESEEESTQDETEETDSTSADYEEIVSGTISDAKEALEEMDNPDYDTALAAEEDNKDRKTFKEYLKNQVE